MSPKDHAQTAHKVFLESIGEDSPEPDGKDPAAVALGSKGGKARAARLSPAKRKEIAKKAAAARWKKD